MTVYVVSTGEYSGWSIVGIYSSHELAIESMGGHPEQYNDIDEYELDSVPPAKWRRQWHAGLQYDGSAPVATWQSEADSPRLVEVRGAEVTERGHGSVSLVGKDYAMTSGAPMFRGVSFVSFEHAKKLAAEARQHWLRSGSPWEYERGPNGEALIGDRDTYRVVEDQ